MDMLLTHHARAHAPVSRLRYIRPAALDSKAAYLIRPAHSLAMGLENLWHEVDKLEAD